MFAAFRIRCCAVVGLTLAWAMLPFGTAARAAPADAEYVALGDSYSAGEGEPPFENGTDMPGNYCHRSVHAYPVQYASRRGLSFKSFACSGATTDDFFHGGRASDTPDGQIAAVPPLAETITLTIGGNDIGFARIMRSCTTRDCTRDPEWANLAQRIDELASKLHAVYEGLHQQAIGARIFVLGYPVFLTNVNQVSFCNDDIGLNAQEKDWANGHLEHLNRVVRDQAGRTPNVSYVDVQNAFRGHEVCTLEPWSNGWDKDHWRWSYHPKPRGHQALAEELADSAG